MAWVMLMINNVLEDEKVLVQIALVEKVYGDGDDGSGSGEVEELHFLCGCSSSSTSGSDPGIVFPPDFPRSDPRVKYMSGGSQPTPDADGQDDVGDDDAPPCSWELEDVSRYSSDSSEDSSEDSSAMSAEET